jgi:hypothetical protein
MSFLLLLLLLLLLLPLDMLLLLLLEKSRVWLTALRTQHDAPCCWCQSL